MLELAWFCELNLEQTKKVAIPANASSQPREALQKSCCLNSFESLVRVPVPRQVLSSVKRNGNCRATILSNAMQLCSPVEVYQWCVLMRRIAMITDVLIASNMCAAQSAFILAMQAAQEGFSLEMHNDLGCRVSRGRLA